MFRYILTLLTDANHPKHRNINIMATKACKHTRYCDDIIAQDATAEPSQDRYHT